MIIVSTASQNRGFSLRQEPQKRDIINALKTLQKLRAARTKGVFVTVTETKTDQ